MDGPKSSNKDRRRAPTRNTTKNTTTSAGTMNGNNASDPYDKDYVARFPQNDNFYQIISKAYQVSVFLLSVYCKVTKGRYYRCN